MGFGVWGSGFGARGFWFMCFGPKLKEFGSEW